MKPKGDHMKKTLLTFLIIMTTASWSFNSAWAISCKELNTDKKIKAFFKKTRESNPLLRKNLSSRLQMKTNDLQKKEKKEQLAQTVRLLDRKRLYFIEGPDAPNCIINRGERDFICSECTLLTNSQCRSYKSDEDSTTIQGTNIDTADFDRLEDANHVSVCKEMPKKPAYLKIITTRNKGDSPYDIIEKYYDKKKEIPVIMNYFSKEVLRKVYRFFPKYYIQLDGEWVSTVTRVRTTKGSEKRYVFETLIYVQKNQAKKYLIHLDPKKDPLLKGANWKTLFNTN